MGRHHEVAFAVVPERNHGGDDLWDDVAGFAEHHRVTDTDPLAHHLVRVVEGGHGDGRSRHQDRVHRRERGDAAGAADTHADVEEPGVDLLRRVFVGDRPAGGAGGGAKPALGDEVIHLDHDAVDLVFRVVAVFAVIGHVVPRRGRRADHLGVARDRKPEGGQSVVGLALAGQLQAVVGPDAVDDHA